MKCALKKRTLLTRIIVALFILLAWWSHKRWSLNESGPLTLPYVVVHLDFKGAPPKLSYLKSLLPMLKHLGANGLLMEYEDMFPYAGRIASLSADNCYNQSELHNFLKYATNLGFAIIPLIQTFGHMEFALKRSEFRHLREEPHALDSICPSNPDTRELIHLMLDQVIQFHNEVSPLKYVHIGCDEVYHINKCLLCQNRNLTKLEIFNRHVKSTCDYVKDASVGTKVLIWDDMLRDTGRPAASLDMPGPVEPVSWHYSSAADVSHLDIYTYHKSFGNIWIASAFKGADGNSASLPNIKKRFLNHYSWMAFLHNYSVMFPNDPRSHFKGIILTGWSRYSHLSPMCELLPPAIPSLLINLMLIKYFKTNRILNVSLPWHTFYLNFIESEVSVTLKCTNTGGRIEYVNGTNCDFNGADLNTALGLHTTLTHKIRSFLVKTNMYINQLQQNLSSFSMEPIIDKKIKIIHYKKQVDNYIKDLLKIAKNMTRIMDRYFNEKTIYEYVNLKTEEYLTALKKQKSKFKSAISR